jgi:NAD(P)-dependent dehydrogenase (short-subunit alcohol dehydrogenase family)
MSIVDCLSDNQAAVAEITKHTSTLDQIFINAATLVGLGPVANFGTADLTENFTVNVVGPHNIFKAFAPFVVKSKSDKRAVAVVSSAVGSIAAVPIWAPMVKDSLSLDHIPLAGYSVSK